MLHKVSMGLSVLAAQTTRSRVIGDYHPEADALFARMSTQPDAARKALINALIGALKASATWNKLDYLYIFAAHTAQAARLNWVANDALTSVSAPLFTADRGFKGDGVGAHLEIPYNQATLANASQNNASWLLGVRAEGANSRFVIGGASAIRFSFSPASSGINVRNTQGATNDIVDTPRTGRFGSTRSGELVHRVYRNGGLIHTSSTPSVAPASSQIYVLRGGTNHSDAEVTHYGAGAGLTSQQHADVDAALSIYLTATGAA